MSQVNDPEIGFYRRRYVRNGPWVAARIWFHTAERDEAGDLLEDEGLRCEIDGEPCNPYDEWERLYGEPIDESEFKFLSARRQWAIDHAPTDPHANVRRSVDLNNQPPVF